LSAETQYEQQTAISDDKILSEFADTEVDSNSEKSSQVDLIFEKVTENSANECGTIRSRGLTGMLSKILFEIKNAEGSEFMEDRDNITELIKYLPDPNVTISTPDPEGNNYSSFLMK
jgi:hypothetical protein